jgi:hypothetical protein
MKLKKILTILLLAFVVGSVAYMVYREQKMESPQSKTSDNLVIAPQEQPVVEDEPVTATQSSQDYSTNIETNNIKQGAQLIVYYFHGDMRCPTCHKLETYAKEALDTYFANELASKDIIWKVVNVDKPENRHFIQDYKLVTKSVVLSEINDGKEVEWKNLEQIWQKVGDKGSYLQYVRESILEFLKGAEL